MASFVYTKAKTKIANQSLNLATSDMRVALVMTNTTADTEEDTEFISGFTTLDEFNGSGYARQVLTGEAINEDLTNNRAEFNAVDVAFGSLGAGTRQCAAVLVYKHVTNDADSIPVAYIDNAAQFPFTGNGSTVNILWNAEEIIQFG